MILLIVFGNIEIKSIRSAVSLFLINYISLFPNNESISFGFDYDEHITPLKIILYFL